VRRILVHLGLQTCPAITPPLLFRPGREPPPCAAPSPIPEQCHHRVRVGSAAAEWRQRDPSRPIEARVHVSVIASYRQSLQWLRQ
jgi:hypothetical protein